MANADPAKVISALFSRAELLETTGPQLQISWPEPREEFVTPESGKFLEVSFFPNIPRWQGLSGGKKDQGLLQINVVWPKRLGLVAPMQVVAQVEAHFAKGLNLFSDQTKVTISAEPWHAQAMIGDDRVTIPITIPWEA